MNFKALLSKEVIKKVVCVLLALVLALVSLFVVSKHATSPDSYRSTIQSIDEKKIAVAGVTAAAAATATGLALIPGEGTTPLANQIMELSSWLMIVVCALVLEKSLLTVMGYLSFQILIPLACLLFVIYIFSGKRALKMLAMKFVVFALVLVVIVPVSMKVSDKVYEINEASIEAVTSGLEEDVAADDEQKEKTWYQKVYDKVKEGTDDVVNKAKQILNKFIDAIAIFVIAYCAVPIIIIFVVIWFINYLFGLSVHVPKIEWKRKKRNNNYEEEKELMKV